MLEARGVGRWCQRLEAPARGAKGFSRTTIIFSPGRGVHTRDGDGRVTSTVKHAERAIERRSGPRGGCAASDAGGVRGVTAGVGGNRLRPLYLSFLRRNIALHRASEPAHKQPTIRQEVLRRVMRLPTTLHKVASRPLSSSSPPAQLVKKTHKTHLKNPQDQMKPTKPTMRGKSRISRT